MRNKQELAIANSRPKGGNESRPDLEFIKTLQNILENQWSKYPPAWFITIQWSPAPYDYQVASGHAKHFRNKFLTAIYDCNLKQLPEPVERCKLIWFHERAQDPSGRLIYHSHLHLTNPVTISSAHHLQWFIRTKVAPGFKCLNHLNRKQDPGLVIRPWNHIDHAFYNLKDHHRFKNYQDADLVIDYLISDLIMSK